VLLGTVVAKQTDAELEILWKASDLRWAEQRRRENCEGWISFHQHLVGVYSSQVAHHEREVARFEKLRDAMKGEAI
jgi:hypothetical protein